jgi:hypothetical protein
MPETGRVGADHGVSAARAERTEDGAIERRLHPAMVESGGLDGPAGRGCPAPLMTRGAIGY